MQTGLSEAHSGSKGITMCQRRTLQYVAGRCGGAACSPGGEESLDREENAGLAYHRAGAQSFNQRADRAEGSHGY